MKHIFNLVNLAATKQLANLIAKAIFNSSNEFSSFVVTLNGDLGSGKTTLVRDILQSVGITNRIKSPTFTIVEPYKVGDINIYHFDLYRFNNPVEWDENGFNEYLFENKNICFIEWADNAKEFITNIDWNIKLDVKGESRIVELSTRSNLGEKCLMKLIKIEDNLFN